MDSSDGSIHPKFVDEAFRIVPEFADLAPPPGEEVPQGVPAEEGPEIPGQPAPAPAPGPGPAAAEAFTEDDCLFLSEALWSLPGILVDRIPQPDPGKLQKWNSVLFRYCVKKGINPFDYLFDELPLIIATAGLAAPMWKAYQVSAPPKEPAKPARGTEDYDHEKEVARQKAEDLAAGRIRVNPEVIVPAPLRDEVLEALGAPV